MTHVTVIPAPNPDQCLQKRASHTIDSLTFWMCLKTYPKNSFLWSWVGR